MKKSTFDNQPLLPRLPVPKLEESMGKLYISLLPFIEEEDEARKSQLKSQIEDFQRTLGPQLQQRLLDHAKDKDNWLDAWWLKLAYLSWREALAVNSNWFMVFADHPEQPRSLLHPKLDLIPTGHVTLFQLYRAAGLISNALGMKEAIENGEIAPEYVGKGTPQCMNQYKMMFGWYRQALPGCDKIVNHGGFPSKSRHIIVLFQNQVYVVDVYDQSGSRLSLQSLQDQLMFIVNDCAVHEREPPICYITGDHRDHAAKARDYLLRLSDRNRESFHLVESSLFSLCLDDWSLPDNYDLHYQNIAHGMGGKNRWFEKTVNIVCMSNGRAGMNGEHSPCDALIPSRLMDWLVEKEPAVDPVGATTCWMEPKRLKWDVDETMIEYIDHARETLQSIVRDSDAGVLIFDEYGSSFMKNVAKVSPDAYVQMVLQLAYYRLHGKWTATYETGSTRKFLLGRTETVRTCSVDSVTFLKNMGNPDKKNSEKYSSFLNACKAHSKYTLEAMDGRGVDRHLLGLRLCLKEGESHELFQNPLLAESTHFRLSTSALSNGKNYNGTGFGAVVPDGYGTNYCIDGDRIKFGIESKKSCRETSTERFREAIVQAFRDIKHIVETSSKQAASSL